MAVPRNFSFILDDVLAGSAHPAHSLAHGSDLRAFFDEFGLLGLISLDEVGMPPAMIEEAGIEYLHLRIPDFCPPSIEQISEFIAFVDAVRARGKASLAHCFAGMGRTGTMLACYLIKDRGLTADEAIIQVRRMRAGSIETYSQEDIIHAYARSLQGDRSD